MTNVKTSFFLDWPYDEALSWMSQAQLLVKRDPAQILVASGSHKETVITMGRHGLLDDVVSLDQCIMRKIDRGGGATAHEPGQIVLYPVLNILHYPITIPALIAVMENAMIDFLSGLGIHSHRSSLGPGVFVNHAKIGFIGLRISEHVTTHGLAINVLNNAHIFSHFAPCGIKALPVTSAHHHVPISLSLVHCMELLMDKFLFHWHHPNGNQL